MVDRRGAPGVAKSEEHRARISEGVSRWHADARTALKHAGLFADVLSGERGATRDGEGVVNDLVMLVGSLAEALEAVDASHEANAAGLRAELEKRGGNIRRMDDSDIATLVHRGLIDEDVARKEYARRVSPDAVTLLRPGAGVLPPLPDTGPGRRYLTANYAPVDLDAALEAAEVQVAKAAADAEQAAVQLAAIKAKIDAYDAANDTGGVDGD